MQNLGKTLGLAFVAALLLAKPSSGAIVYSENFPNANTGNQPASSVGWFAHIGPTAVVATGAADETLVAANNVGKDGTVGYGADQISGAVQNSYSLFWTNEPGTINLSQLQTLSFYSNNAVATDTIRLALRLDNNTPGNTADDFWVATNAAFVRDSATAGLATNWVANGELESFTFNSLAATWRDLTFTAGSTLSLAATTRSSDLPLGGFNAIGFYISGATINSPNTGVVRFDALAIDVIPEPTTWAATLIVALGGIIGLRRRLA